MSLACKMPRFHSFKEDLTEDRDAVGGGTNFIGLAIATVIGIIVFIQVLLPVVEEYTSNVASDPMMVALLGIIPVAFVAGLIYFVLKANDLN